MASTILLSSAYFPPVSWFAAAHFQLPVQIEYYEYFEKQSYRNRCQLMTANGINTCTVPVQHAQGKKQLMCDIKISYSDNWQQVHWRTIQSAYGRAPYFEYFEEYLEELLSTHFEKLVDLNEATVLFLLKHMGSSLYTSPTTRYEPEPAHTIDLRQAIHPKRKDTTYIAKPYQQCFAEKFPFTPNLSMLDLLLCRGPKSVNVLGTLNP